MAIEQNSTITVGSGAEARTFGISKSLDQYSLDELLGIGDWAYSAFNDSEMNANVYSDISTSGTMIDIAEGQYASRVVCYPDNQLMSKGYNTNSEGVFFRNVLIYYDVTETNWASSSVNVDAGRFPHYYVVTDIDLQDLVIDALSDPNAVASSYTTMKLGVNDVTIAPFQLYLDQNGELSLNMLLPPVGGRSSTINPLSDLVCYSTSYGNWSVYTASGGGGRNIKDRMPFHFFNPNRVDYPFQDSRIPGTQVLTDADKLIQCVKTDAPNTPARFHYQYKVELMDKPYLDSARCGIRFNIGDVIYKPIVTDGMITGYTDDDTVTSEWDTWETIKDHVTPSERPTPTPPEEDPRDASIYGTYSGGAGVFARCWYCNQNALNSLWLWSGGSDDPDDPQPPEGFSPINSIIGLQLFPVNIPHTGSKTAIVFFNAIAEGDRTVNTHVSDDVYLGDGKTFEIDLGSVTVDAHHANDWAYLDYDETVELYIPFCGVYNIDTQAVMGKTITAKLYVDPIAGTCTFIATCDNVDVAMGSGSMAVSLPVTANQYSMTLAAINTNRAAARNAAISSATVGAAQVGASFASGYSSGYKGAENQMLSVAGSYDDLADIYGAGNPVRIARGAGLRSGLANAATSISNGFTSASIGGLINSALNTRRANKMLASSNNTAVSGSFGGSQDTWRLPMQAYLKTIRYMTKIPNNHVDVIGKIFLQETTLANCSGYTTVANPNLSSLTGFLTTAELTELYGILLNGIYAGGGAE